eukprot:m.191628 g.191628  ORF g.191628 m.191628 type:complete len:527 (+) comp32439_c0_seq1:249-1829(+)
MAHVPTTVMMVFWCVVSALVISTVTGVEVTCDPDTESSSSEGNTFIVQNMNQLNSHPDLADGRCTKIRGDLKIQCQQDIVANRNGGQIQNISWLSNVVEITGYLHLEDCDDITTLEPLKNLRTIGGSPGKGLYIFACSSLEDVKGLENLKSIAKGGVKILRNQILCFADLMYWSRITDAAGEIQVLQVSENCTSKTCASDCHCGFCGGSGSCNQQGNCDDFWYDTPGWVDTSANTAGYAIVILFALIFTVLFIYIIVQCFRKQIKVKIYVSSIRPAPESSRGFRPIVNRKLNLDAQRRLGSIVPPEANEPAPFQPSLSGFSLPGLVDSKEEAPHVEEQERAEQEEAQQEPDPITNRPLKPFSNFLHRERKLIETTLVSRKSTDPNISAQKVAADLWQGSADIQQKFKTEYARDFRLFSEYVGKGEWVDSGAGTWQQWVNELDSDTKKPYIAAGLEKDKVRRRMQRNARKSLANSSAARLSRASFGSFDDIRAPEPAKPELPRLTGLGAPRSQPTLTPDQPDTDVES